MWRWLWISVLATGALGQTPSFHQVSLTVVDFQGKPIANARVDHAEGMVVIEPSSIPAKTGTDARGRATFKAMRHAVVVRKPGYVSARLLIDQDGPVRVTLLPLPSLKCEPAQIPGVKSKFVNGGDYGETWTYVDTPEGQKGFAKGRGPSYSWGAPIEKFVQDSIEYSELMYPDGVVDAKGKMPDGTYWRERTIFGEGTHYWKVDEATAHLLDRLIDGDCHLQ